MVFPNSFIMFVVFGRQPVRNRLRLYGRQDNVIAIRNDNGSRASAISSIDEHMPIPRLLDNPFYRCRFRTDNGYYPIRGHDIAKPDVNQLDRHGYTFPPVIPTKQRQDRRTIASSVDESGPPHTVGLKMPILFVYRFIAYCTSNQQGGQEDGARYVREVKLLLFTLTYSVSATVIS
jgi:hypothetical protein